MYYSKGTSIEDKIKQLKELEEKIDNYYHYPIYQKIETKKQQLKEKIKMLQQLFKIGHSTSFMSDSIFEIEEKLRKLKIDSEPNEQLSELIKIETEIDTLYSAGEKFATWQKYNTNNYYSVVIYKICGIRIEIDLRAKKCKIDYNKNLISILNKCKIAKAKKILQSKLKDIPVDSIIKTTQITEQEFMAFLNTKTIPLDNILKSPPSILLTNLGIYRELNKEISLSEILNLEPTGEFKDFYEFIQLFIKDGFEIKLSSQNKENNQEQPSLSEDITNNYKNTHVSIEDLKNVLARTISSVYQTENFIYSSLQTVYNSIDREIIKKMHEELNNNVPLNNATNLNHVIEIMRKYSCDTEGKQYTEEEILNFLNTKNQAVNSDYSPYASSIEDEFTSYYQLPEEYIDINQIMYKLTGKRR